MDSARFALKIVHRDIAWMPGEYPDDVILSNTVNVVKGELEDLIARIEAVMNTVRNIDRQVNPEVVE